MGPLAALAKVIDNTTVGGKLTDAHSESDVRDITALPKTFGANQQPAVPGSKIWKENSFAFAFYPVLRAVITLSFSVLVLSPLSFSTWEGVKWGIPRGSTFSLTHSADDINKW